IENSRAVTDDKGHVMYFEGALTDITEVHELSSQLSYEASHDSLTNLINRREFELRLERLIESSQQKKGRHAVCYLDLDQFKVINDTCGHIAGDELLCQVGKLLQKNIREGDTVARLGGDEFGVILENCSSEHAKRIANNLREAIEKFKFVWSDAELTIGVSIGVVALNSSNLRMTEILSAADSACYAAKDQGRNRVQLYNPDDTVVVQRHGEMLWVSRIKRALEEHRFHLFYQPIVPVNPEMGGHRHYEILLRMMDRRGRIVLPGEFLPAAERYNLSVKLDTWVLGAVFSWLTSHPEHLEGESQFFINLSGGTMGDEAFHPTLLHELRKMGLPSRKFCFEITETAAIADIGNARTFIDTMRKEGCHFALDDFGSGLSSFAYLKNLPVDYIKIDGMFTRDVEQNPVNAAMVKSITEIGHVMGKIVIAEHVESQASLACLKSIGVDYVQGYALGKPRPIVELVTDDSSTKDG
ncbi:MAG: EAL domain-containing protein, partial [Proteobacteria bacterium]|nr:EAL domain-containing protein [Pseudomonadota bacterium]